MRFFRRDCRTFLIRERKKERFLFSLYITLYISYGSMYPRTKKISRSPELHEHLHFTFVTTCIRLPYLTFSSFPVQQQQQQQQSTPLPSPSITEKLTDTAIRLTLTEILRFASKKKERFFPSETSRGSKDSGMVWNGNDRNFFLIPSFFLVVWAGTCRYSFFLKKGIWNCESETGSGTQLERLGHSESIS